MASTHNFASVLASRPYLTLDGALATELEKQGCNLSFSGGGSSSTPNTASNAADIASDNDTGTSSGSSSSNSRTLTKLWSAQVLVDNPQLICNVHADYFTAGADVAITASYQASVQGLRDAGFSDDQAVSLITNSVVLAQRARDQAISTVAGQDADSFVIASDHSAAAAAAATPTKQRYIAGSIGPYGAYLADGSEYRGNYGLSVTALQDFHRPRMQILLTAGVDILACETIPSLTEVHALIALLAELDAYAWISLTLRDAQHMSDGTPLLDVASILDGASRVLAFGVNCVPPELVAGALGEFALVSRSKPFVVYANSGEGYDAVEKRWIGQRDESLALADRVVQWYRLGARLVGGCCRTSPGDMRVVESTLRRLDMSSGS